MRTLPPHLRGMVLSVDNLRMRGPSASWVLCSATGGVGSVWQCLSLNILHLLQRKLLHPPPESKVPSPPFPLFSCSLLSNNCMPIWRNRAFQKLLAGQCLSILLPVISSPFSSLWRPVKRRSWRRMDPQLVTLRISIWSSQATSGPESLSVNTCWAHAVDRTT